MSFTIDNVKQVLEICTDSRAPFPQETMLPDLKRDIAKVTEKMHPLSLTQFVHGMEDIGIIEVRNNIVVVLCGVDEI